MASIVNSNHVSCQKSKFGSFFEFFKYELHHLVVQLLKHSRVATTEAC